MRYFNVHTHMCASTYRHTHKHTHTYSQTHVCMFIYISVYNFIYKGTKDRSYAVKSMYVLIIVLSTIFTYV